MPTGDLKNNLRKLQTEVKLTKYPEAIDIKGLTQGDAKAFMPILHYAFTSYSPRLAEEIAAKDIVLFAKSDAGFMDSIYKVLRDMFSYRPLVTKDQFFSTQFAERKIIMCTEVLQHILRRCRNQQPTKTSVRLNSSMDNIARPPSGRMGPRSAVADRRENRESANTSMPPPRPVGASTTSRIASNSTAPRSGLTKYRPASARTSLPGPTTPQMIKKMVDPNLSLDSALSSLGTQSIVARVKPQSAKVVTKEMVQTGVHSNGIPGASVVVVAEPAGGDRESEMIHVRELEKKLEQTCRFTETLVSRVGQLEAMLELQKSKSNRPSVAADDSRRWADMEARLKLLENRVLILESKALETDMLKIQSPANKSSPVTPGKAGTFVTVESFVNGESKVRKMARQAEAKIRSHSLEEDTEKLSPIVRAKCPETPISKSEEEMFTIIPDPKPCDSSTPSKTPTLDDSINLKCVDTPTQDQAHRIHHLVQGTKSLLSQAQTEIPADEVARQDVD